MTLHLINLYCKVERANQKKTLPKGAHFEGEIIMRATRKPLFNAISLAITASVMSATAAVPVMADQVNDENFALEEVIVTAAKRTQSLQDIPVSVQVLGNLAELLELVLFKAQAKAQQT